jgi:hypothetical protein
MLVSHYYNEICTVQLTDLEYQDAEIPLHFEPAHINYSKCNSTHSYIQTAVMLSCYFIFIDVDHRKVSVTQSHGQAIHTTASKQA